MNETTIKLMKNRMKSQRISQQLLCQGICSEFTLSYYLNGKRPPDPLTFITLLERLRLPTNMFTTYLFHDEVIYFQERNKLLESALHSDWKQVQTYLTTLEQKFPSPNSSIPQQFLFLIKGILSAELKHDITTSVDTLTKALCFTKTDFSFETVLKESHYSFDIMSNQEWCTLLNLLWVQKDLALDSVIIVLEKIRYQLEQYSLNDTHQLNIYSYVTYILAICYFKKKQYTLSENLCQTTIILLHKHGILGNLINLIECNIACQKALHKIEHIPKEQDKLNDLQQILQDSFCKSQWILSPMLEIGSNIFPYQSTIAKRRKQMNISQADLCDTICSVKTLRKLELGKLSTNEYVLHKILHRLKLPVTFMSELVTTDLRILLLHQKMIHFWLSNNIAELENCLVDFKMNLDNSILQNQQWIFFFQNIVNYANGVLKDNTYRIHIESELQKYFSNLSVSQIRDCFFTPIEVLLLLQLAQGYEYENNFDKAILILNELILCCENQEIIQEFQHEYIVLLHMELSKCYKKIQNYEPILQITNSIIKRQVYGNRIDFLRTITEEMKYTP